jgi:hypothetical protein
MHADYCGLKGPLPTVVTDCFAVSSYHGALGYIRTLFLMRYPE